MLHKGKLLLAAAVSLAALFAHAQTLTWSLPADWEAAENLDYRAEPVGAPNVPYYSARIAVPKRAASITITAANEAWAATGMIRPEAVREPSIVGEALNAAVEDAALYAGTYPSATFEQFNDVEEGTTRYLYVRVNGYRWNGAASVVEKLTSLTLSVNYNLPRLAAMATAADTAADYIVISPPAFTNYWEEFVAYRRTTHTNMTFAIVNTADIYSEYSGGDDALKIHHFLEAMYKKGTRYVLLGAGSQKAGYDRTRMIPTRTVCIRGENTQACDWYYCVMDNPAGTGEIWDYNGDGIYLGSKNSSGGYAADSTDKFSWWGKLKVHRFPARSTVNMGGKSKTAQEQIHGYVEKLRSIEQDTLFDGRFSHAILGNTRSSSADYYWGNTSTDITMEREFYDLGANMWAREHGNSTASNEYQTRERAPSYFTLTRPVGTVRGINQIHYQPDTMAEIYARDYDSVLINAHGSPETVEPMTRADVWKATGAWRFHIMIIPCHGGNIGYSASSSVNDYMVSLAEASVLNPDGGSLVCYANTSFGWYGGKDVMSQKVEKDVIRQLYGCFSSPSDAGTARQYGINNYGWSPSPANANGQVLADSVALGDPLVTLSPIWSRNVDKDGNWVRGDQAEVSDQEYASTLTVDAGETDMTMTITNDIGAATLNVTNLNGKTLTIAGSKKFKTTNTINVDNGNLTLDVEGGFGRNGIVFNNGSGKLKIAGDHTGYYGTCFGNVADLEVAGNGATLDFDAKGYVRNGSGKIESLRFTGSGENTIRAREGGIFSSDFTIPVTGGGTLVLQTQNIGGAAAQDADVPLFAVTNATVAVSYNPNWKSENFTRSVWLEDGNLESRIDTFYLGQNGGGYPGYDIWVGGNSGLKGSNAIRLNGELRIHTFTGGVVTVSTELMNGGTTGSITLDSNITLKMAYANSFSGAITVPSGSRVVVDNAGGLGTGSITVQSGGALQLNAMPITGVKKVTLESGAKLVLASSDGASYNMYKPANTTFTMAEDVKVYDAKDENTVLDGIVTPEGAYFISSAAKTWRGWGLTWSVTTGSSSWLKNGTPVTYADGDTVLFKNTDNAAETVYCSGDLTPGMMAFQNTATAYTFEGDTTKISVSSLATVGNTTFKPTISASTQVSVGAKTTFSDITTPLLNAASGSLKVDGTANGIETYKVVKLTIDSTQGVPGYVYSECSPHPLELSEFQLLDENQNLVYFPTDTTIVDSEGNTAKITGRNGSVYTFESTSTLTNLFDGSCASTSRHIFGSSKKGTITITLSEPLPMFKYFRYGRGDTYTTASAVAILTGQSTYPDSNPFGWRLAVGDTSASLVTVINQGASYDGNHNSLTGNYTATKPASSKATVNEGAKLYLSGTYKLPLTINSGAIFAVTNDSVLTISGGRTLPTDEGSILIDTSEALKTNGFFKVTSGLNLATDQVSRFAALDDSIAFKIDATDHELYVATEDVAKAPYSTTIDKDAVWGSASWIDGDTNAFKQAWSASTPQPLANINIAVAGTGLTLSNDCTVSGTTLTLSSTNAVGTFTVKGAGSLSVKVIDATALKGNLVWSQELNGADFYAAPSNTTTITSTSNGGKLVVPEGATVILKGAGLFTSYENSGYIRYAGTYGSKAMTYFATGDISIYSATLTGGLQSIYRIFHELEGDALGFNGEYNSRLNASFDVTGGNITLTSGGAATWFGHEGSTTYRQTDGTFTCTANGTSFDGSANGLVLAYNSDGTEPFPIEVYGGVFEVPNSSLNFWRPTTITIETNGLVRAKGVYTGNEQPGTITVGQGGTFELGSLGIDLNSCTFNLFGGTLAGYETGAKLQSGINFSGTGTIAAKEGTTFKVLSSISGDGNLIFGATNYTGMVTLSTLPEATNWVVAAGTLNLGELRATEKTLDPTSKGAVAISLTNTEIKDAQTTPVQIIKATKVPEGGVKVYSSRGALQTETKAEIDDEGYLTVMTTHDNTVQVVSDAKWSNVGNTTIGGIATGVNQGYYDNLTANFGVTNNMIFTEIGSKGTVKVTQIRFAIRESPSSTPTGLTITQGDTVISSSSATATTDKTFVCYMYNYLSNNAQRYSWNSYTFTFTDDAELDTSKDFTMSFSGVTSTSGAGIRVISPANSKLQISSTYSPMIEIVGDYSYDTGESVDDEGGDSISINVIGGNKDRAGQSITKGEAGAYPIAVSGWNQLASHSVGATFDETTTGLTEVRADGTVGTCGAAATLSGACTYTAGITATNANAELEFGYIDDGSYNSTGAHIAICSLPYSQYDLYVYMGTDQTTSNTNFAPVTVTSGNFTTNYPAASTKWGDAAATHGEVTLQEGVNYFKVSGLTGSSVDIQGTVNSTVSGARCGIAGVQIVNTGIRYETYTWNGENGNTWSTSDAKWLSPDGAEVAWPSTGEGNVAQFNAASSATVSGTVKPAIISIGASTIDSDGDYVDDTESVVFANTQLRYITGITGKLSGGYMAEGDATPYYFVNNGTNATVQLQKVDDTFVKCVKITLKQSGDDVVATHTYAKYVSGSTLGQNFDSTGSTQNDMSGGHHAYCARALKATYATLDLSGDGHLGAPVTVKGGLLSVTPGLAATNITLAADAGLNVPDVEEYSDVTITEGDLLGVEDDFSNLFLNGSAISTNDYELTGGTLKFIGTIPPDLSHVYAASNVAFNVSNCDFTGTAATNIWFIMPKDDVQEVTGTKNADRLFGIVVNSGILNFTAKGGNTSFEGRTVTADGSNAVIRLTGGDNTGYTTGGTMINLLNGGTLEMVNRDTMKTPVTMKGGTFIQKNGCAGSSQRGLDLFNGDGNNWTILADEGATDDNPTVSTLTYEAGTGADGQITLIRDGAWNIDVAEHAKMVIETQVATKNYITFTSANNPSGTPGALVKKGAGVLELKTLPLKCDLTIEAGTINLAADIGASGLSLTRGTLTGATAENIYVNGVKLADSDYMLSGNAIVARALTAPLTAALEGTNTLEALTWTAANGLTVRASELAVALTNNALVVTAAEGAALKVTNDLALVSLAITNATIKFEGAGTLTTTGGVAGEELTVDATDASVGALDGLTYPNAITNILIVGEATGLTALTIPTAPEGFTITSTEDKKGFVIAANEPPAAEPVNYTKTFKADGCEYNTVSATLSQIDYNEGTYTNGADNTVTITVYYNELDLTINEPITLKKLTINYVGSEDYPTVRFVAGGDKTIAELLAGVAEFDFGGFRNIRGGCDLGARVTTMPSGFIYIENAYAGVMKSGYGYQGDNNKFSASEISAGSVFVDGTGTINGELKVTDGGQVSFYGSYSADETASINIENGMLTVDGSALSFDMTFGSYGRLHIYDWNNYDNPLDTYTITSGSLIGLTLSNIQLNYKAIDTTKWHFTADGKGITTVALNPTVDESQGTIAETNGVWVVTPAADTASIAVSNAGTHTIVVPPSVTNVTGVATNKIVVKYGDYDYSALFSKSGDAATGVKIVLTSDKTASVKIGDETITLEPVLTAIDEDESKTHAIAAPFVVGDGSAAVGIKSIPGLMYTLVRGGDLIEVALPSEKAVEVISTRATDTRLKLEDGAKPDDKAFYIIRVGQ